MSYDVTIVEPEETLLEVFLWAPVKKFRDGTYAYQVGPRGTEKGTATIRTDPKTALALSRTLHRMPKPQAERELYWANYTVNVSRMWDAAGLYLPGLAGHSTDTVAPLLSALISVLRANPEGFKEYEPDSGWGSYEGGIKFLEDLFAACIKFPGKTLRVSV